jgi:hypothetical protein
METNTYNLFLDDIREPYDAFLYTKDTDFSKLKWTVVRNYEEFVEVISSNYKKYDSFPNLIAFDHDLADEHYEHSSGAVAYSDMEEKTGMHCAKWLIDFCLDFDLPLPNYKVHSMNPAGKQNILGLLNNFKEKR